MVPEFKLLLPQTMSRGGLIILSINLVNYASTASTILKYSVDVITQLDLPRRIAAERILRHFSSASDNFE